MSLHRNLVRLLRILISLCPMIINNHLAFRAIHHLHRHIGRYILNGFDISLQDIILYFIRKKLCHISYIHNITDAGHPTCFINGDYRVVTVI